MKRCTRCGDEKSPDHFPKQTAAKDGLHPHCNACRKSAIAAWREANPDKVKAAASRRVLDGRARRDVKNYRERHPKRIEGQSAARYAANPDAVKAHLVAWAIRNPQRRAQAKAEWRRANPESARASKHNNRAKRRAAVGSHTASELADLFEKQRGMCTVCRTALPAQYHVDHVEPIAAGGSNDIGNIQLLCPPCNQSKSAKDPIAFMQERGFLL